MDGVEDAKDSALMHLMCVAASCGVAWQFHHRPFSALCMNKHLPSVTGVCRPSSVVQLQLTSYFIIEMPCS
jgi:hypothetical protein